MLCITVVPSMMNNSSRNLWKAWQIFSKFVLKVEWRCTWYSEQSSYILIIIWKCTTAFYETKFSKSLARFKQMWRRMTFKTTVHESNDSQLPTWFAHFYYPRRHLMTAFARCRVKSLLGAPWKLWIVHTQLYIITRVRVYARRTLRHTSL